MINIQKIIFLRVEDYMSRNTEAMFKTWKNAIVEYLDYQIPVTQLKGPKGDGDMRAAKRNWKAPPTRDLNIWLCVAVDRFRRYWR